MSLTYQAVGWNRQKRLYDATLAAAILLGIGGFIGITLAVSPHFTAETVILRGTAVAAILLLHVVLAIGPLCRLDERFLPWLYNRRHLGVTLFLLALVHAAFAVIQFHALGDENPLVSVFTAYQRDYQVLEDGRLTLAHFPFEPFGAVALLIFFLMAATSHDFWLRNLGPAFWKGLHLSVYVAYGLVIAHVALGVLQSERNPLLPVALGSGFLSLAGLHLAAARKEARIDRRRVEAEHDGFTPTCRLTELKEGCGRVVVAGGRRLALFRHEGRVFATSNICRHQGGPLGEGRILEGCITCPWHGWNYRPEDGCSPPPFEERIATHDTRVVDGRVFVRATPNPLGTRAAGACVEGDGEPSMAGRSAQAMA